MKGFRPTLAQTINSMQKLNNIKTNATIRDLEEDEGELEEKEGVVVSIKRDLINGAGWTVKDSEGQIYVCSCATSMYDLPQTTERGGILYPSESIKVIFTVNPVLRVNTIKEIKTTKNNKKLDISKWQHNNEATTIIAKPKSALSISDGFITMNYDNNNKVVASPNGVSTEGDTTNINTNEFVINSENIKIQGDNLQDIINNEALDVSNEYDTFDIPSLNNLNVFIEKSNNMTQIYVDGTFNQATVIGEIKDQKAIPVRVQNQQLLTDGNCIDIITIDTDGVISIAPSLNNPCTKERKILSTNNFITPQIQSRNYIKTIVKKMCDFCNDGNNATMEYINYCPSCQEWNTLVDTGTSIKCSCGTQYCQNCGKEIFGLPLELKKYSENYISVYGTTCQYCQAQLQAGTTKQYVNYCPNCKSWGELYQTELYENENTINILKCSECESEYCGTCGIDQNKHGLTLERFPVEYYEYKNAFRKLKYIKDGA